MLVLKRKKSEEIVFFVGNEKVEIKILNIDKFSKQVQIGVTAPREIKVVRKELLNRANDADSTNI